MDDYQEYYGIGYELMRIFDYYTKYINLKFEIEYKPGMPFPYNVRIINIDDNNIIGECSSNGLCLAIESVKDNLKDYIYENLKIPQTPYHVILEKLKSKT